MNREEKKIMLYTYGIKDSKGKMIITLSFSVKFFKVDGDLYLENEKARILVEALNEKDGKKSFEQIINMKIREAIANRSFFKLIAAWNMEIKPSINHIMKEKSIEFEEYNARIKPVAKMDFESQMYYSSDAINRFGEMNKWSVGA